MVTGGVFISNLPSAECSESRRPRRTSLIDSLLPEQIRSEVSITHANEKCLKGT